MRCRRLRRTRAVAHVLVRRPSSAARREHPIHTFVVPFPRLRGEREPWEVLHRTMFMRLSSKPATVIRTTSGIPPEDGMNPRGSTRSPDIKGPASKDSPCSRRPRSSQAAGITVPADLVFICSSSRVFFVGQGQLRLSGAVHFFPFPRYRRAWPRRRPGSVQEESGPGRGRLSGTHGGVESWTGSGRRRTLAPPGNGKVHAAWVAGLLGFDFLDLTGR